MNWEEERLYEQARKEWLKEVNAKSPHWEFKGGDYEDFLELGLTINEWLASELQDGEYLSCDNPYGEPDAENS